MAVVNHNEKWLFFCEPHTASRATQEALLTQISNSKEIQPHHCPPKRIDFDYTTYTCIAAVRNPYETQATKRCRPSMLRMDVDQYLDVHWGTRDTEPSYQFWKVCDRIIYHEFILEDLARIFRRPINLGWEEKHKTPDKKPFQTYFTEYQFAKLGKRADWKEYMKNLGYDVRYDGTVRIDPEIRERLTRPIPGA